MATVSLKLNITYKDKDNKSPVIFIIRNKGTHSHISTGIKTSTEFWNKKTWIKKACPDVIDHNHTNAQFLKQMGELQDFIYDLTCSNEIQDLTASQIKAKYLNKKSREKLNFTTYFKYVIRCKSESTARIYQDTFDLIQKYIPGELSFSDVNNRFLREFQEWHNGSVNGTGIHLRNIRHVFNMAITDEIIDLGLYPFRKFKIKKEETKKRNLNVKQTQDLRDITLTGIPQLARDIYMLQFYLIGISLKDLVYMPKSALKNERIQYQRMKTSTLYNIKVEPEAMKLIKILSGKHYLINLAERYQNYNSIKKEINKKLKVAGSIAGIDEKISTYWSRHSWATFAAKLNIPDEIIALSLGHKTAHKTTAIYIERELEKIDRANRQVINLINWGPHQNPAYYQCQKV